MYLKFILLLILSDLGLLYKCDDTERSIFDTDRCIMKCNGRPHTLCNSNMTISKCVLKQSTISDAQRAEMKYMLIMGHNGLRNRIAERMRVANMVEMVWHDELALMASNYISMCKPYETDVCATLPQSQEIHRLNIHSPELYILESSYHKVAQNRYLQRKVHYPNLLVENALRAWYMERDTMDAPTFQYDALLQSQVGCIISENNFTHLASPLTTHFGCAFNKITLGYLLVCNYHPYRRLNNLQVDFLRGDPGSLCPVSRPMKNSRESMTNLCIGEVDFLFGTDGDVLRYTKVNETNF